MVDLNGSPSLDFLLTICTNKTTVKYKLKSLDHPLSRWLLTIIRATGLPRVRSTNTH